MTALRQDSELHDPVRRTAVAGAGAGFADSAARIADGRPDAAAEEAVTPMPNAGAFRVTGPVLVVEDNPIIAFDMADMLRDMAVAEVHIAASVAEAVDLIETAPPVAALLDVDLGRGETSLEVAERLAALNIPFVLTTGHADAGGMLADFPAAPVLRKPFDGAGMRSSLAALLG